MTDPFGMPRDKGPWFDASYPGECAHCGAEFDEGERVRYVDGELACEDCG